MDKSRRPSLSIIIATYNSERTLARCLTSIRRQNYPREKIEIILADSGSNDKTLEIGKQYGCKIIHQRGVTAEAAKAYGLQNATGEIIADFGSDNILPGKNWFKRITAPFQDDDKIIASYPLRYTYQPTDTIFNRYVALFGVNDPVPFYLGKADRQSYLYDGYHLAGDAQDRGNYYMVRFNPENLPTVGANGFFIKKDILKKARVDPKHYFHIDVVYDLVGKGYNTFAVVKTSIIHDTADTLSSLVKKRRHYFSSLYLKQLDKRRYHIVGKKDYGKLALFILFSFTFIQPVYISVRGYRKKPDLAWFIHPLFCFMITLVYGKAVLVHQLGLTMFGTNSLRAALRRVLGRIGTRETGLTESRTQRGVPNVVLPLRGAVGIYNFFKFRYDKLRQWLT